MQEVEYKEVRYPGHRPHKVGDKEFDECGALFFGINDDCDCDITITCRVCKQSFFITNTEGNLAIEPVPEDTYIKYSKRQEH